MYVTQRGQLALSVHEGTLLTKALRPPPAKYHGLGDTGTRYRYRELDLLANETTRELFVTRARTIDALRAFLAEKGFIEVETPVLQALAGGASARPFLTHHHALDQEMSLRISVELYLNRCLIGGLENVYDLGKCFRNEGISYRHSPEFTMLEWLMAYADHTDVARFTEEMVAYVAERVLGTTLIERGGEQIDLAKPWRTTTMRAEIKRVTGVDFLADRRAAELAEAARWIAGPPRRHMGAGGAGGVLKARGAHPQPAHDGVRLPARLLPHHQGPRRGSPASPSTSTR